MSEEEEAVAADGGGFLDGDGVLSVVGICFCDGKSFHWPVGVQWFRWDVMGRRRWRWREKRWRSGGRG